MCSRERKVDIRMKDILPHIVCGICKGFLVDAVTLLDCSHSFCRSCFLDNTKRREKCPTCGNLFMANQQKAYYKNDEQLQSIIYKLIPALQIAEERDRKVLYETVRDSPAMLQLLKEKSVTSEHSDKPVEPPALADPRFGLPLHMCSPNDPISFGFEFPIPEDYFKNGGSMKVHDVRVETMLTTREGIILDSTRCFFTTRAKATISTLKKFLRTKYLICPPSDLVIVYGGEVLQDDYTLCDVVQTFLGGMKKYIHFYFQVVTPCDVPAVMPHLEIEKIPGGLWDSLCFCSFQKIFLSLSRNKMKQLERIFSRMKKLSNQLFVHPSVILYAVSIFTKEYTKFWLGDCIPLKEMDK